MVYQIDLQIKNVDISGHLFEIISQNEGVVESPPFENESYA